MTALFGIFPGWLVTLMIDEATPAFSAAAARDDYTRVCAGWGNRVFADVGGAERLAVLLERAVDAADVSALPLVAGWRAQARPTDAHRASTTPTH